MEEEDSSILQAFIHPLQHEVPLMHSSCTFEVAALCSFFPREET